MITGERTNFLGAHISDRAKVMLKLEAERRKLSISRLVSNIIEDWLHMAPEMKTDPVRSNKREKMKDVSLPLGVED